VQVVFEPSKLGMLIYFHKSFHLLRKKTLWNPESLFWEQLPELKNKLSFDSLVSVAVDTNDWPLLLGIGIQYKTTIPRKHWFLTL
jgi:hypothetical protein